jgi:bifunctional non-homologous end joining protein LigD
VRLFTRNCHDWTDRFPLIVEALNARKATTCLIDGEAVTCTEGGLADFDGLRSRRGDVHLCAFDLLELDGHDLRLEPLTERRRLLARLIRKPQCGLVLNEQYEHDGSLVFEHACLLGCEGIVSKRQKFTLSIRPLARIGLPRRGERIRKLAAGGVRPSVQK